MMSLLLNPALLPILLLLLALGTQGGWARRAMIKRFGRDFAVDAAGASVLLALGAVWGLAQQDQPASRAGVVLALLAILLSFVVLGAFTLGGARRSPAAWMLYIAFGTLLFGIIAFAVILWIGSLLRGGSFA